MGEDSPTTQVDSRLLILPNNPSSPALAASPASPAAGETSSSWASLTRGGSKKLSPIDLRLRSGETPLGERDRRDATRRHRAISVLSDVPSGAGLEFECVSSSFLHRSDVENLVLLTPLFQQRLSTSQPGRFPRRNVRGRNDAPFCRRGVYYHVTLIHHHTPWPSIYIHFPPSFTSPPRTYQLQQPHATVSIWSPFFLLSSVIVR